ncbi:hypothetical protein HELRODRAFT_192952 [Helobdella robusta]|uniref:JmjC domain-containing protein n=1 Tax=Helobdella robusta TaxID=6412 RepID=T1FUG4_HELRO|nr:hypothetical protein HELRODRAFT_192952 [Helobdella robusta]ESN98482.1 hypothetical protein HELRODRAFT_192952 [Helobdella robusta]
MEMELSMRAAYRIKDAKRKARSELKEKGDWRKMNFAVTFTVTPDMVAARDNLERIDYRTVSEIEFFEKYDKPLKPVVITHVQDNWPALHKWDLTKLSKKYSNQLFKCGEDDKGSSVKLKMKYFFEYMSKGTADDSPLYIFDSSYGEHPKKKRLLWDYFIPKYFQDDLFKLASDHRRPPHRWLVVGPRRSGTGIHVDPLGTSAWNALVSGHKWWCLFPPQCPKQMLKLKPGEGWKNRSEAISWFSLVYPRTQEPTWPPEFVPMEVLQRPGETMYVPSGWWHVVINLDNTVAVTQNFCTMANFNIVWYKTAKSRPRLAKNWHDRMKIMRPELAKMADEMDLTRNDQVFFDSSSSSSSSTSQSEDSDSDSSFQSEKAASLSSDCGISKESLKEGLKDRKKTKKRLNPALNPATKSGRGRIRPDLKKSRILAGAGAELRCIPSIHQKNNNHMTMGDYVRLPANQRRDGDNDDDDDEGDDSDDDDDDDDDSNNNSNNNNSNNDDSYMNADAASNSSNNNINNSYNNNNNNNNKNGGGCSYGRGHEISANQNVIRSCKRHDRSFNSDESSSGDRNADVDNDDGEGDDDDAVIGYVGQSRFHKFSKKRRRHAADGTYVVGHNNNNNNNNNNDDDKRYESSDDDDGQDGREGKSTGYSKYRHRKTHGQCLKEDSTSLCGVGEHCGGDYDVRMTPPIRRHQQKVAPGKRKSSRDRDSRGY